MSGVTGLVAVASEASGHVVRIAVSGELDLVTSRPLAKALDEAVRARPERIVVDLDRVTFIDAAGVHVLVDAERKLNRVGATLTIANLHEPMSNILRMVDVASRFH